MIWFTSDWHLGHQKILEHEPTRPADYEARLWDSWDHCVRDGDDVWFLGDFALCASALRREHLARFAALPGTKHWTLGNHDAAFSIGKLTRHGIDAHKVWAVAAPGILVSHYPPTAIDPREPERVNEVATQWETGQYTHMVHGHAHSNKPFRWGPEGRWVNVSPEVTMMGLVMLDEIMEAP